MAKIAWVVGASSGIGWHLVRQLAARGWHVAASARRAERLEELATKAPDRSGAVIALPVDVTDEPGLRQVLRRIEAVWGSPEVCFLNAGGYERMTVDQFDVAVFRRHVEVNLMGAVHGLATVLPGMLARGRGQVLITSSVAGYRGLPFAAPYGVTKAALINLAETLRFECAPRGVTVRVIDPGFVKTPLTDKNRFEMPFLMEPEDAARRIIRRLDDTDFEITFPRRFTWQMKLLRLLPYRLYFPLVARMTGAR